jgi:DNA polymerase-1
MKDFSNILENLNETPPPELNDHILMIDAMNTLIRSFALLKAMNPSGTHVGGLVGFMRSLGYINRILEPTRIVVVWDGKGGGSSRKNINPEYKAHRQNVKITNWGLYDTKQQEMDALIGQLLRTQDYLDCLPVHQVSMEKIEADDVIAYLAKEASSKNRKVTIYSSDKDFLQLIDKNIQVYSPIKKKVFDYTNIQDELKVLPENYNIVKALLGDNSDGLIGIKGLGIKTIVKEFPEISSNPDMKLDAIFESCEGRTYEKKIFSKILANWELVEQNFIMMDLHDSLLDKKQKDHILDIIKSEIPDLQSGAFLHLLDQDKIEGITKNTEGWLEVFRSLTVFTK